MEDERAIGGVDVFLRPFGIIHSPGFGEIVMERNGPVFGAASFGAKTTIIEVALNRKIKRGTVDTRLASGDDAFGNHLYYFTC